MDFGDILSNWEKSEKENKKNITKSTGQEWRNKKTCPNSQEEKYSCDTKEIKHSKEIRQTKEKIDENQKKSFEKKINPMTQWLNSHSVIDKDSIIEKQQKEEQQIERNYLLAMPYEATIDLHGLKQDEAIQKLNLFIDECSRRDIKKVLIIHGKGNHSDSEPVLNRMVRSYIERDYRLGESGHPDRMDGGKGATWVIIKKVHKW